MPIFVTVVDAALLYSATLLASLVLFVTSSNGQYIVLDMASLQFFSFITHLTIL
jgi:hypothetical protein